jgi:piezo-type mechanosensitive ion channel component 1/2
MNLSGRFLRMAVSGQANRVVLSKMPEPMSLLQLVSDIFSARDDCDILLEEKLFRELIEIYRSPEAIIKMTEVREKEE